MPAIRLAAPADSSRLLRIYAQYMATPITFECTLPTEQDFAGRIERIAALYPYLVCEENGNAIGFAYAHRPMERAAYQWNAELTVYLDRQAAAKGLGKRLYSVLSAILQLQGVRNMYGCVTVPNAASEGLHRSMGFRLVGIYRNAGFKGGQWHDVAWFEKAIEEFQGTPDPITSIHDIPQQQLYRLLASA